MKKLIFVFAFYLLLSSSVSAEVSKFVFVTEPRSVSTDTLSETITIQSQNSLGESENITETHDIVFQSSSPTGEFFSTTGNPVSTTMSKNTANKNFLYKDSTSGTHTLTITATGRTSLISFTATQDIVVGEGLSNPPTNTEEDPPKETEQKTETKSTPINTSSSAHGSPAPLSNTENKIDFQISAGRNRLTSVGNSITFRAEVTKTQNISPKAVSFTWSFGDGAKALGDTVTHHYDHPGDYVVVLNGSASDKQAVSRLEVKVIDPNLSIKKILGGIEISNNSPSEINFGGWVISNENTKFTIPEDTLVPSKRKIVLSDKNTKINTDNFSIADPSGRVVYVSENKSLVNTDSVDSEKIEIIDVLDLENKLKEAQKELSILYTKSKNIEVNEVSKEAPVPLEVIKSSDNLANVIEVFVAPESPSLARRILELPVKGFGFLKRLFVEN